MLFRTPAFAARAFLASAIVFLLAGCSHGAAEQDAAPIVVNDHGIRRVPEHSPLRDRLKVQAVAVRDLAHALTAPAIVEADPSHTLNILPPVTGRIVELKVALGDRVTRGQVLAVIASGDYAQASSDEARARDAMELASKAMERAKGVNEAGGAAQKDLEAAQSSYAQAQAEFQRASSRLASLGRVSGTGSARGVAVVSPVDGSVTALSAAVGGFANDPNASLMTITDLGHVWITANVAENDVHEVARGQQAEVTLPAWPGRSFHGVVQSVSDVLDPDSRRVKARIAVPNEQGELKANMYATATFDVPRVQAVLVPQSALLMNNDDVTVFVETAPWTFTRRAVVLGGDEGDEARIVKGLAPGDRVVTLGGVLIND